MLAVTDFRLKYFDALLSYAWALLRPAIFFGLLLLIFGGLGGFDNGVTHYPAYLVLGVALWTFFIQTTSASLYCLTRHAAMLRKLPFPRLAVPLSNVVASAFDFALNAVVALAVLLLYGITPRPAWVELILLLGVVVLVATGVSLVLSAAYVRYRDLDQLWSVAGQALFYLTPIFYAVTTVPEPFRRVLVLLNPLAAVMTQARHVLIDPAAPTAAAVAGGYPFLLCPLAVTVGTFAVGLWIFRHESPKAPEYV
jgi:ABC-2 type transport system permease protein